MKAQIFLLRDKLPSHKKTREKRSFALKVNWYTKYKFELFPMNQASSTMSEAFTYRILYNHCTTLVGYHPHLMGSRGLNKLAKVKYSAEFESRTHFSRENAHSMGVSDAPLL